MKIRRWSKLLLPSILFALTACGPAAFSRFNEAPREGFFGTPGKRAASAACRQEIGEQLQSENYRSALELVRKEIRGGVAETALAEEYGRAVNGVLGTAELYRDRGLPEKAGELYRLAHEGFPETAAVAKRSRLTRSEIKARIDACAGQLMERGLVAYRGGDLEGAIKTWKMIQTFDPRHQASRKAMETAEVQRINLEKVRAAK